MAAYFRYSSKNTKRIVVHVLICVFASAAWVDVNGMWSQLPLLTENAKEGWSLPSYLTIISQAANVGPILYMLVSYLAPWTKPKLEKVTSFVIIIFGMVICLMLAFLWQYTSFIGGTEHSTALLVLHFFLALGDCTSSLSFYAFMAHLKPEYISSLFIGEGLSGLVPAVVALGQGVGEITCNGTQQISTEPNFSVQVFFIILSATMAVSAAAFLLLNFWGYCQSELIPGTDKLETKQAKVPASSHYGASGDRDNEDFDESLPLSQKYPNYNGQIKPYLTEGIDEQETMYQELGFKKDMPALKSTSREILNISDQSSHETSVFVEVAAIPLWKVSFMLALVILLHAELTTFLGTVQIYSILPYGLQYYHLVTTLPQIANPLASLFALFLMSRRFSVILTLTALGQVCVAYIIYLAAASPSPPLQGTPEGGPLAVTMWILVTFLLIYVKVCIAGVMRDHGRGALIALGVCTQVGSLLGAVVGFVLVNIYNLFVDAPYCP